MTIRLEQHFYATDELPQISRVGLASGYRTVAASAGVPPSLFRAIQEAVDLGSPEPAMIAALEASGVAQAVGFGCWRLDRWVVVSCARAFAHVEGARPWTYFAHSLLVEPGDFQRAFGADPFQLWRMGLFATEAPAVDTADPLPIDALAVTPPPLTAAGVERAAALADLVALVGTGGAADLFHWVGPAGGAGATEPRVLLTAPLRPDRADSLAGLVAGLPTARRAGLSFWSYRFAVRAVEPFHLLVVPPEAEVGRLVASDAVRRMTAPVSGDTTVTDNIAPPVPVGDSPDHRPGGFGAFAADCVMAGQLDRLADAVRFLDDDTGLGQADADVEVGLAAFRACERLADDPSLSQYVAAARLLLHDPRQVRAVQYGFTDVLMAGFEFRIGDADADGAARTALERAAPDVPALLAQHRDSLVAAGLGAAAQSFARDACRTILQFRPPRPWHARFARAAVTGRLVAVADVVDLLPAWLEAVPHAPPPPPGLAELAAAYESPGAWLEPWRDVLKAPATGVGVGTAPNPGPRPAPAEAAWLVLDAAAGRGLTAASDPWAGAMLRELWAAAPPARAAERFVATAARLRDADVFYPALSRILQDRAYGGAPEPLRDALAEVAKANPAEFRARLARCLADAQRALDDVAPTDLGARLLNLLASLARLHKHLPTAADVAERLDALERTMRATRGPGAGWDADPALRRQFFVGAYAIAAQRAEGAEAGSPFPAMALRLCEQAVEDGVDASQHAWPVQDLWLAVRREPGLVPRFVALAARLGAREPLREALTSALTGPALAAEMQDAVRGYLKRDPDACTEDCVQCLARLGGVALRGAARPNAQRILQWIELVTPPSSSAESPVPAGANGGGTRLAEAVPPRPRPAGPPPDPTADGRTADAAKEPTPEPAAAGDGTAPRRGFMKIFGRKSGASP